jgi:hypothetical protein
LCSKPHTRFHSGRNGERAILFHGSSLDVEAGWHTKTPTGYHDMLDDNKKKLIVTTEYTNVSKAMTPLNVETASE